MYAKCKPGSPLTRLLNRNAEMNYAKCKPPDAPDVIKKQLVHEPGHACHLYLSDCQPCIFTTHMMSAFEHITWTADLVC